MTATTTPFSAITQKLWQRLQPEKKSNLKFDDQQPLRLELFSLEQLQRHATSLALRHEISDAKGQDLLLKRLADNEAVLLKAYDFISEGVQKKQRISPAGEWLLDNFHLIEEQIRIAQRHLPKGYSRELPHLVGTGEAGFPRVYDLALEIIAHVDGRVDQENIMTFVSAYQDVSPLKLGEFWAIPIMLRLALIENLRRVASRVVIGMEDRIRANELAKMLIQAAENDPKGMLLVAADMARSNPSLSNSFVAEFTHRLQGMSPNMDIPLSWVEHQLIDRGTTIQQTVQLESQQQAANQVSVSASIGSLRYLSAMDWRDFVESMSVVEKELRHDPANIYSSMDFQTRDQYRHVIERLGKNSDRTEREIARQAVMLACEELTQHPDSPRKSHVGYFLVDDGLNLLEKAIAASKPLSMSQSGRRARLSFYLGTIFFLTLVVSYFLVKSLAPETNNIWFTALLAFLILIGTSQITIALLNWIVTVIVTPRLLPRLDFSKSIPESSRTVVTVPTMLTSETQVDQLLESLEVRYLANRDENLHFVLLSDFPDADQQVLPGDTAILEHAKNGIIELNQKYQSHRKDLFFLMHRPRLWNEQEKTWMAFERKRGKLEALNAFLRGKNPEGFDSSPFIAVVGDTKYLSGTQFVITLDTDTQLPRESAHKLIGTMAHPLNLPVTEGGRLVKHGYAIMQPRVAISLPGSRRSWYVRLYGGDAGIDPYTRAISDVYQDLFHEGSFIGKGIYHVDAFSKAMTGSFPNNLILSHDLLEGSYARCALVSDVTLYEEHPYHYGEDMKRRHRWIRGDWQIIFWLLSRLPSLGQKFRENPIAALSKWKIFDNLRRSIVPIATLLLLIVGWVAVSNPWRIDALIIGLVFLPTALTSLAETLRKPAESSFERHLESVSSSLRRHLIQGLFSIVFLPFEAVMNFDAIVKSIWRMAIAKRGLLEWRSPVDPQRTAKPAWVENYQAMIVAPIIAISVGAYLTFVRHESSTVALPFLALWFFSPSLATTLSRIRDKLKPELNASQRDYLRKLNRKTWRFFEEFVTKDDNWLAPDNYQEYPNPVVAHRTSPTNIGLSLLSNLAAFDFGFITATQLMERTSQTFATMERLERFRGHFYNWYDTQSLRPLIPMYVSTVDSGNLSGLLLTLRQGLLEMPQTPIITIKNLEGLADTLSVLTDVSKDTATTLSLSHLHASWMSLSDDIDSMPLLKGKIIEALRLVTEREGHESDPDAQWWFDAIRSEYQAILDEIDLYLSPWLLSQTYPEMASVLKRTAIPSLSDIASVAQTLIPLIDELKNPALNDIRHAMERASLSAVKDIKEWEHLAVQCEDFANFEYDFLYDKTRNLLAIGYNVGEHRRDSGFYDLLASEARLCSFIGIAQRQLPQEHWFALGRLLTTWQGEATLLSWSGSMFEYLMPLLVMPTFDNTLLDQTYRTSVQRQVAYGEQRGVPWGISESGYNTTDVNLNYQYRAFGVPGLGFKRGLAEDLVIAPYASMMCLMVAPEESTVNLQKMSSLGFEGSRGFFEAIDYTPSRLANDQSHAVVRSYMAHHQGMAFLSMAYLLLDCKMQKRFNADPLFKATELLLHERIPKMSNFYPHALEVSRVTEITKGREVSLRVISTSQTARPEVHLLSNGRYSVMVTNSGGGYSRWKDLALTRWREDPTADNWGTFCYVRDVVTGKAWSAAHHPLKIESDHYEAIFPQAKAEFRRQDNGLEMHTEITVSPEDDIELRRFSLTNRTSQRRVIELTSYAEVVMTPLAADLAHPAFNKLFVQTEIIPSKHAIICTRRPRSAKEKTPTMLHLMTVHGTMLGEVSYETDRTKFLGRGRSPSNPIVMESATSTSVDDHSSRLSGQDGSVLDPIVAIRCQVVIEPEQTVRVHMVTGIGETRETALSLIEKYHDRHLADRVFELAWTHRQVVMHQLNITDDDAQLYARLASAIIYTNPARRASPSILTKNRRGQSGLWGYGISGDKPIVLLRISDQEKILLAKQLVQAHAYWRMMGLEVELVIWNEDDSGYRQLLQEQIMNIINSTNNDQVVDHPGGIFVRRAEQMAEEDRILLQTVAKVIITDSAGTLADQLDRRARLSTVVPLLTPSRDATLDNWPKLPTPTPETLQFDNGLGGFTADGREYVITTTPGHVTPAPWSNVLANPYFGSVVSESGAAYTWCENAHEFRLTPWNNDPLSDSSGEAFYLRDEDSGQFWSPTPWPVRSPTQYVSRHGFGFSNFKHAHIGIQSDFTTFVAIDAPVKFALIKLKNRSGQPRKISITGYCEWVLGELREKSLLHVVTEVDPSSNALFARNPYIGEFGARIAFLDISEMQRTVTCDRSEFLGRNGSLDSPEAMTKAYLSGKVGASLDACGAVQSVVSLADGEEKEVVVILGVGRDADDVRTLIRRFRRTDAARSALGEVRKFWQRELGAVQVETPDPSFDVLANGWLLYQVLASRIWARSGYYQSGGAYGFRDQLQDAMSMLHADPRLLRAHILRCAAHQFHEGDVQHWWHPPADRGVRTHFSDDFLWLPLATCRYVAAVGDTGILNVRVHFIEGRPVKPDEEAYFDLPAKSADSSTLYDHCVRAIRRGMRLGKHGMPLIGCGDWNDGMNLIGEHGQGESVWLAFFQYDLMKQFSTLAHRFGDSDFADECLAHAARLQINIEENAWDGAWYRRAYFDDGTPLGSAQNEECQIDSLPQSWAVLSGAGSRERAQEAMMAVDQRLVKRDAGLIQLFDPPFDKSNLNPGYIKGYVPGVRENGGQYTHAAIWTVMAFAAMGDSERAYELLSLINPVHHGRTLSDVAVYKVEPYVIAADVYGVAPHTGKGGWTWYTGSAGWMYRLMLESILGLKLEVDHLSFTPCIPANWKGYKIRYRFRETVYHIAFERGEPGIELDGQSITGSRLPLCDDQKEHQATIKLPVVES